jgi:hypothetical protein
VPSAGPVTVVVLLAELSRDLKALRKEVKPLANEAARLKPL